VDGLVTRDRDTDANGTLDERLFALQDANWNVTGITNTSGTIQERYTETPYGAVTFRDGSGSTISVSTKGWDILHQGAKADIIGDYDFRNRVYSPTLWRWLSNDPLGFEAGDVNTFRYVGNGPGNGLDPLGKENIKEQIVKRHYTFPLVPSIPGGPVAIGQIQIIRVGNSQNNEPIPMWSKIFEKYEFMEQVEKMKKDVKDGEIVTGLVPISLGSISVGVFPGKNMIAIGGRSDRVTFKYPIYWPIYSEIDKNKIIGGFPIDLTIEWKTNFGWRSEEPGAPKDIK
jgi:RHS repeat-associated protein